MICLAFFGGSMGAGEILLVLCVMLLFFGADRLPSLARTLGRTLAEFRRAASELRRDLLEPSAESGRHDNPSEPPPAERPG